MSLNGSEVILDQMLPGLCISSLLNIKLKKVSQACLPEGEREDVYHVLLIASEFTNICFVVVISRLA